MSITSRKLAVAVASVALSFGVMEAKSAQAATITGPTTWNLSFFDDDEQVGSGQFNLEREPFEGIFAEFGGGFPAFVGPGNPEVPFSAGGTIEIDASDNFHQLNRFGAQIGETSYDLSDGRDFLFFIPPEGDVFPQPTAGVRSVFFGDPRFPGLSLRESWLFGETVPPIEKSLLMSNDGSFFGGDFEIFGDSWTAEPVPEPSTIAGTLLAGGALGAWTRRKRKAQQERTKEPLA